ncbi:hypothetical protein FACS1894120_6180 [Clostridia bacterium]|nr:hypothetical protein FACS1894120_6180 [Clostridia bacterium]
MERMNSTRVGDRIRAGLFGLRGRHGAVLVTTLLVMTVLLIVVTAVYFSARSTAATEQAEYDRLTGEIDTRKIENVVADSLWHKNDDGTVTMPAEVETWFAGSSTEDFLFDGEFSPNGAGGRTVVYAGSLSKDPATGGVILSVRGSMLPLGSSPLPANWAELLRSGSLNGSSAKAVRPLTTKGNSTFVNPNPVTVTSFSPFPGFDRAFAATGYSTNDVHFGSSNINSEMYFGGPYSILDSANTGYNRDFSANLDFAGTALFSWINVKPGCDSINIAGNLEVQLSESGPTVTFSNPNTVVRVGGDAIIDTSALNGFNVKAVYVLGNLLVTGSGAGLPSPNKWHVSGTVTGASGVENLVAGHELSSQEKVVEIMGKLDAVAAGVSYVNWQTPEKFIDAKTVKDDGTNNTQAKIKRIKLDPGKNTGNLVRFIYDDTLDGTRNYQNAVATPVYFDESRAPAWSGEPVPPPKFVTADTTWSSVGDEIPSTLVEQTFFYPDGIPGSSTKIEPNFGATANSAPNNDPYRLQSLFPLGKTAGGETVSSDGVYLKMSSGDGDTYVTATGGYALQDTVGVLASFDAIYNTLEFDGYVSLYAKVTKPLTNDRYVEIGRVTRDEEISIKDSSGGIKRAVGTQYSIKLRLFKFGAGTGEVYLRVNKDGSPLPYVITDKNLTTDEYTYKRSKTYSLRGLLRQLYNIQDYRRHQECSSYTAPSE